MKTSVLQDWKIALTAIGGTCSAYLGWFGWLVIGWGICMLADFVTGCMVAGKNHEWKSKIARDGLWRKFGMIVAVAVSAGTDWILGMMVNNLPGITFPFSYTVLICPIVLVWYSITELGSIMENAGKMGAPVPKFLRNILAQLHEAATDAGEMLGKEKTEQNETVQK